jgi:hypothetical protein
MLQFLVTLPHALRGMFAIIELGESNSTLKKSTLKYF